MVIQDFCGRTHKHPNGIGSKCDFVGWGGSPSNEDYTFEVNKLIINKFIQIFIFIGYAISHIHNSRLLQ